MSHRMGFTRTELLVTASSTIVLASISLAMVAAGRSRSFETTSLNNLRAQGVAHAAYAKDWGDRQFTVCPDNLGASSGNYNAYVANFGCPPTLALGYGTAFPSAVAGEWAFYIPCNGGVSMSNFGMYQPILMATVIGGPGPAFIGDGAVSLPNLPPFTAYLSGRFMDPVFYAPADAARMSVVGPGLASPNPVTFVGGGSWSMFSSYILSASALFHPTVFGGTSDEVDGPFVSPFTFAESFASPSNSQCLHPDLKSRLIERSWLQGQPHSRNPNAAAGTELLFNMGADSVPMALFFDGHAAPMSIRSVLAENDALESNGALSLWMDSEISIGPWAGLGGFYSSQSLDGTATSVHVFTRGGILGRDRVTAP